MRFHKFISTILHPIVMPTIGTICYLILTPNTLQQEQELTILTIIFIATYVIPLLLLIFLKSIGYIDSFQVFSIKERKIPLVFMIIMFYLLGQLFEKITIFNDLSFLFYGIAIAIILTYILFTFRIKSSLHLLSIGGATGYFLIFGQIHGIDTLPLTVIFLLFSGLLGTSRLHLKAHSPKEIYIGFFLGFFSQIISVLYYL